MSAQKFPARTNPLSLVYRVPEHISFSPGPREVVVAIGGTKMERAQALFDKYPQASRQYVMDQFQQHLSMTRAGASTYYTMIKAQRTYVDANDYIQGMESVLSLKRNRV